MSTALVDGTSFHYREAGSGPSLFLVHGTGAHADLFEPAIPTLAEQYRVIAYDRRGYRRTKSAPAAAKGYLKRQVDDAAALLRTLGAGPAAVVGWSAGGAIALGLAAEHPDLVSSLVLYDPAVHLKGHASFGLRLRFLKVVLLGAIRQRRASVNAFLRLVLAQTDGRNATDDLDEATRAIVIDSADTIMAEIKGGMADDITSEQIRGIKCPITILVGGVTQPFLAEASERLAKLVDTRTIRVDGAGHLMMSTHTAEFVRVIRESLATSSAGTRLG